MATAFCADVPLIAPTAPVTTPIQATGQEPMIIRAMTVNAPGSLVVQIVGDPVMSRMVVTPGFRLGVGATMRLGISSIGTDQNQDGVDDALASALGLPQHEMDNDHDGVSNAVEKRQGSNPFAADSDGDGVIDGWDPAPLDRAIKTPLTTTTGDATPPVITIISPTVTLL
jgi:hypothetical protein